MNREHTRCQAGLDTVEGRSVTEPGQPFNDVQWDLYPMDVGGIAGCPAAVVGNVDANPHCRAPRPGWTAGSPRFATMVRGMPPSCSLSAV